MKPLISSPLAFLALCLLTIAALALVAGLAEWLADRRPRELLPPPNREATRGIQQTWAEIWKR